MVECAGDADPLALASRKAAGTRGIHGSCKVYAIVASEEKLAASCAKCRHSMLTRSHPSPDVVCADLTDLPIAGLKAESSGTLRASDPTQPQRDRAATKAVSIWKWTGWPHYLCAAWSTARFKLMLMACRIVESRTAIRVRPRVSRSTPRMPRNGPSVTTTSCPVSR